MQERVSCSIAVFVFKWQKYTNQDKKYLNNVRNWKVFLI